MAESRSGHRPPATLRDLPDSDIVEDLIALNRGLRASRQRLIVSPHHEALAQEIPRANAG